MQAFTHLSAILSTQAALHGDRRAFEFQDFGGGKWKGVSWALAQKTVQQASDAMLALGIEPGEKVGVFSHNCLQYVVTDFAAWGIRAVTVPFYVTSSEDQLQFIVNDARIRYIFVGEQEQYAKARRLFALCPGLHKLIVYDRRVRISTHDPVTIYFDDFLRAGLGLTRLREVERLRGQAQGTDLMSILYTSGTTGVSKGVMLTHSQAVAAIEANAKVLPLTPDDRVLNFLPFTHIFEKGWSLLCLAVGCTLIILNDPQRVQQAMQETHPTAMCAVPRFWEKVYQRVMAEVEASSPSKRRLFRRALEVGRRHNIDFLGRGKRPPLALALEYKLMNATVFSIVRRHLGLTRPHFFPTAGAAVSAEVEQFIRSLGIFMMVGYGLTESFATVSNDSLSRPFTVGSIGRPLPGVEIKIADDGEILLKGPTITPGYYNRPDFTAAAFTADGYFRTGDAGYMKDGELFFTERLKDMFKTSNGKYIAPQMIESKILVDKYVEQVAVVADERKFVSALIVPIYPLLEQWARDGGIAFANREELCAHPRVNAMMAERLETLQQSLAAYEQVKRFTLLPHHFSMERGELTSTLKIRRAVVARNYKQEIDRMYDC